ncbi:MAG: DNA methyltransferase [bacterium]
MQQFEIEFEQKEPLLKKASYISRLKELSRIDLSFIGKNGRIPLHNVHSFPAKFPPLLPYTFINELTCENEIVLDPMMGSCTTLIEALRLNRIAYGCDIDPLTVLLAEAKLNSVEAVDIASYGKSIVNKAFVNLQKCKAKIEKQMEEYFDGKTYDFINYWFKKETQLELFSLALQINALKDVHLKNFLKLIFSSIIITKNGGVSLATDLAHTRPHIANGKSIPSAFEEFNKKLSSIMKSYTPLANRNFKIFRTLAQHIPIEDGSVDLIITSPPYANNAIDYLRAHKFSLVWFDYSLDDISNIRKEFIGSNSVIKDNSIPLPKDCLKIIDEVKSVDSKKGESLGVYYTEMADVIEEMYRTIKKNKAAIIVVATSIIKGIDSQTHKCLAEIGVQKGFKLIGINERQLDRDRRMMPTRWKRDETSQIESRMHEEYVIIFQK